VALEINPSIFHPSSPEAQSIFDLTIGVVLLCAAILILVVGLITFACIKFRGKKDTPDPKPVYGNTLLESLWTAGPFLALVVVMFFMVRTMMLVSPPSSSGKPDLVVVGHQWWWEIRYPLANGSEAVTANEIHIPVGKRILLELRSADVIHDFWVPDLGRKIDAIPGQPNQIWLESDKIGTFTGFCAEFCGASHAWMQIRVVAESEADFQIWRDHQASPAIIPQSATAQRGLELFRSNTCVNCHEVSGISTAIQIGPSLTHLAGRETLVAGALRNTSSDLARWLSGPEQIKPGAHMPAFGFKKDELDDLTTFLEVLK
jgi:cytochrome c oxidase subunit II